MRKNITEVRKALAEVYDEDYVDGLTLFDAPTYANAIVAVTCDDRVVYDFDKMVAELVNEDGMDVAEAAEFIEYNVIRALPYMPKAPVIIHQYINI